MSSAKIDKLVRMANQIGDFFAPQAEQLAAEGVATHLKRFWTPKMISEIIARSTEADCGLNPTAARGVALLRANALQSV
jgi:formate dehydrogenase subunit delta